MPLYTPDDPEFAALEARHAWFEAVLLAECGELTTPSGAGDDPPDALNWPALLPESARIEIEEVECSLAFVGDNNRLLTIWDATGEDDMPWATFVVDDAGARLLSEYSQLDPDADESAIDAVLARAADELPDRLQTGSLDRDLPAAIIPDWLQNPILRESE